MHRNYLFILVALFFVACSQTIVSYPDYKEHKSKEFDLRLMKAYNYEYFKQYLNARDEFLALYKDYKNELFLESAFFISLFNNLDKQAQLNDLAKIYYDKNDNLKRLSVIYALNLGDLNEATKLTEELLKKDRTDFRTLELYGDILVKKNELKKAAKHYRAAYNQTGSDETLTKLIELYSILNDSSNLKIILENVRKTKGCSLKTCALLAKIYYDEKNENGLKELYIELFNITSNESFILALIELLNSKGQAQKALDVALEYNVNDDIKLFLYQNLKRFDEALKLSLKLFEKTKDKQYLSKAAVFEYEKASFEKNINDEVINSVSKKFEESVDENSNALLLNYYGYLLIDTNRDVKKGIKLVELALKKDPHNFYYLDSLAWGYYKLKDCSKAWEFLKQTLVDKEFSSSNESKEHIRAIKACLNDTK